MKARTRWVEAKFAPASFIGIVRNRYAVAEGIRRTAEPHRTIDTDRDWDVHERSGTIRDMNAESIERLSRADRAEIREIMAPMLARFGYDVLD